MIDIDMEIVPAVFLQAPRHFALSSRPLVFIFLEACCLTSCSPTSQPSSAHTESSSIVFPTLPAQLQEGLTLPLTVRGAESEARLRGRILRYRWLSKYVGEDWTWDAPWRESPEYEFHPQRPGLYDLQVDVAERGGEKPVIQKWLGTIEVQGNLVADMGYSPLATVVPVETPVEFAVRLRPNISLERLEFRVWELLPTNRVVTDWQHWPVPAFHAAAARRTALQVDVRLSAAPSIIDSRWLNDFVFDDRYRAIQPNLLRDLAARGFEILDREQELRVTADALWIATHVLLWEYEGIEPREQVKLLGRLQAVADFAPAGGAIGLVTARSGRRYELDLIQRRMREAGSPVIWCIGLEDRPAYRQVFDLMGKSGDDEKILAAITYAVYCGYHYGTQASVQYMDDLEDTVAHCGDRAFLLREILSREEVDSEFVEISCSEAGHIIVQARVNGGGPLLLDASTARIFRFDAHRLGKDPLPAPLILPETYHIDYLGLLEWYDPSCTARIYRAVVPGVFPLVPAKEVPSASDTLASGKDEDAAGRSVDRVKRDD